MKQGLYANINAKQARIKAGSGEKMRKVGAKGAPTAADFKKGEVDEISCLANKSWSKSKRRLECQGQIIL
jgi:hypothetical protein